MVQHSENFFKVVLLNEMYKNLLLFCQNRNYVLTLFPTVINQSGNLNLNVP